MLKPMLILIASAMTFAAIAKVGAIEPNRPKGELEQEQEQKQERKQKYTCLMHPEVITDHPGNCPKCGMKLVPLKHGEHRTSNVQRSTPKVEAIDHHRPSHKHEHDHPPPHGFGAAGEHERMHPP